MLRMCWIKRGLLPVAVLAAATLLWAASQGPRSPTSAVSVAGPNVDWTNPAWAKTSDDSRATAALPVGGQSDFLLVTAFGFTIPDGATINGIVAEMERSKAGIGVVKDNAVQLVKGGAGAGSNKASTEEWFETDMYKSYGGAADLWGTTWTPTEVNAGDFGLRLAAYQPGGTETVVARVDHVRITVYYTPAAAGRSFAVILGI